MEFQQEMINRFNTSSIFVKISLAVLCVGLLFHIIGFSTPYYRSVSYIRLDRGSFGRTTEHVHEGLWLKCMFTSLGRGVYGDDCGIPWFTGGELTFEPAHEKTCLRGLPLKLKPACSAAEAS